MVPAFPWALLEFGPRGTWRGGSDRIVRAGTDGGKRNADEAKPSTAI